MVEDPHYANKLVYKLVEKVMLGESNLNEFVSTYLNARGSKENLIIGLIETKTFLDLEVKKDLIKISATYESYNRFANTVYMTAGYMKVIDNMVTKIQKNEGITI